MSSAETPGQNNEEFKPDDGVESLSDMPSFEEHMRAKREREAAFGDHPIEEPTPEPEATAPTEEEIRAQWASEQPKDNPFEDMPSDSTDSENTFVPSDIPMGGELPENTKAKLAYEAEHGDHPIEESTPDFEPTSAEEAFGSMGISVEEGPSESTPDFEPTSAEEAFDSMGISVEKGSSDSAPDFEPKSASEAFDSMGISVEEEKSGDQQMICC